MIGVAVEAGIWTITIDRPEKANSLTRAMLVALDAAVERAASEAARAVIFTGAGRVFSAGADLDEMRAGLLGHDPIWAQVSGRIAGLSALTIAALNGTCAGGAMGMVLACDLRVAVPGAAFFYPVMRLGYLPQPGDPARLLALVGPSRAKMILLAGARIDTDEARQWGLIDRVAEPPALMAAAQALAADAVAAEAAHVRAIKALLC